MKKHLKTVKTSIVLGILLSSLIVAFTPSSTAAVFSVEADVVMTYNATAASAKVVPLTGEIAIEIDINAKIQGLLAKFYERMFAGRADMSVDLTVKETPSWCTARISPNVVNPILSTLWAKQPAYVHISFNEDAPAHEVTIITIEMRANAPGTWGRVKGVTKTGEISFTPSYLPIIDATPKSTYKEISPGEIITFDIDLENLGNAETEFIFKVSDAPDGWSASILSNTKVGSRIQGETPMKTIKLFIQPPYDFGYHNDREDIRITVKGRYFATGTGALLETEEYEITFTVRSRGFSTPGFEAALALVALIGVALVIKNRRKIK